jgi:hypothetical protein
MNDNLLKMNSVNVSDDKHTVEYNFSMSGKSYNIYFKTKDVSLIPTSEALIALTLIPCMFSNLNIRYHGNISEVFYENLKTIMEIYHAWYQHLSIIEIKGFEKVKYPHETDGRSGVFFSSGVDSFYSLLKNKEDITDLIYIHGFDISLDQTSRREQTSKLVRNAAENLNINVIEVETNARDFLVNFGPWNKLGHGAALYCTAHLLSHSFNKIYIASSHTYANLHPVGTHPLLDPLWSSEKMTFIHDGCEATRIEKVEYIADFPVALNSIRVCWKKDSSLNCGECDKCVRTMLNLYAIDKLDECSTFDKKLELKNIMKLHALSDGARVYLTQNYQHMLEKKPNDPLVDALKKVLRRPRWQSYIHYGIRNPGEALKKISKRLHKK